MEPLRVALLTSHRAPGMASLLADPNRGTTWELTIVVGSETSLDDLDLLERAHVPVELRPMRQQAAFRNLHAREEYDEELANLLGSLHVDYILLCGYAYILTRPMLSAFASKIVVIHDADLTLRDATLYAGSHAVRDAILGGECETRSSMYLATAEVGRGPLFLLGAPYAVAEMAHDARERGDADFLCKYAELHRERMVSTSWGPMLTRAMELLAGGTMQVIGDVVWMDGAPGPCRFGEGPRTCHEPEMMVARGIPRSCPFIG